VSAPLNINVFAKPEVVARPPLTPPPFKKDDIIAAIDKKLFQRSALKSFYYLAWDLAMIAAMGVAATRIRDAPDAMQLLLWPLYWYAQGCVMTGVWVLAHECGHQSFSPSKYLNDSVGWVLHSALLVPYHSWRISHKNHHSNTCSVEDDEVFAASTRSSIRDEMMQETPFGIASQIVIMLLFGWCVHADALPCPGAACLTNRTLSLLLPRRPAYLTVNAAGPAKYEGKVNDHFSPNSALYYEESATSAQRASRRWEIIVSDIGFFGAIGLIAAAIYTFGFQMVAAYYLLPYVIVNLNLVLITYLQHTDEYVPHFHNAPGAEFPWLRGALATVDRSYGWLLDIVFHHITDTHVVHHLFHEMPFYNAIEATVQVRKFLGPYYLVDHTPTPVALWKAWKNCRFVEDEGEVVFFKNASEFNAGKKASKVEGSSSPKKLRKRD
jgi:omega-6 fatty acid desaturase (delta-12 desaturase)